MVKPFCGERGITPYGRDPKGGNHTAKLKFDGLHFVTARTEVRLPSHATKKEPCKQDSFISRRDGDSSRTLEILT